MKKENKDLKAMVIITIVSIILTIPLGNHYMNTLENIEQEALNEQYLEEVESGRYDEQKPHNIMRDPRTGKETVRDSNK